MSMPTPSLLTRLTDPARRRLERKRCTVLEASTLAAMSLRGNWDVDGDALIVAYPALARSMYLDVPAAHRRLIAHTEAVTAALAQFGYATSYRDAR